MTHPKAFLRRHCTVVGLGITRLILSSTFRYFDLTYSSARVSFYSSSSRNELLPDLSSFALGGQNYLKDSLSCSSGSGHGVGSSHFVEESLESDCEKLSTVLPFFLFFFTDYCSSHSLQAEVIWSLHAVLRPVFFFLSFV